MYTCSERINRERERGNMPGGGAQRVGKGSRNRRNLSNIVPLAERDGKQLVLSCAYKGKTFKASVLPSGEINFGQDLRFSSPSSWVLHCGRTVKPTLQSINGWTTAMYKGEKICNCADAVEEEGASADGVSPIVAGKKRKQSAQGPLPTTPLDRGGNLEGQASETEAPPPGPGFSPVLISPRKRRRKKSIREASILVGTDHQVSHLPVCQKRASGANDGVTGQMVWDASANGLDQDAFEDYIAACGCENVDRALKLLHEQNYDIDRAKETLLKEQPALTASRWSEEEIARFEKNIVYIGKDFDALAKVVSSRSVSDVVQFYYGWKNKRKVVNHGRSWKEDLGMRHKLLGRRVQKKFEGFGVYKGTVVHYFPSDTEEPLFRVKYEDGDKEDFLFAELVPLLCDKGGAGDSPRDEGKGNGGEGKKQLSIKCGEGVDHSSPRSLVQSPSILSSERKRRKPPSSTLTHIVSSLPLPNKPTAKKELMKVMEQETWATLSSHEKLRYLVETNLVNKMSPRPIWQRFTYHIRPETISKTAMV